jgi:hypothetical protein
MRVKQDDIFGCSTGTGRRSVSADLEDNIGDSAVYLQYVVLHDRKSEEILAMLSMTNWNKSGSCSISVHPHIPSPSLSYLSYRPFLFDLRGLVSRGPCNRPSTADITHE